MEPLKRILTKPQSNNENNDGGLWEGALIGARAMQKTLAGMSSETATNAVFPYVQEYLNSEGFKERFERTKNLELKKYVNSQYDPHSDFEYGRSYDTSGLKWIPRVEVYDVDGFDNNGAFYPWKIELGKQDNKDYDTVLAHELGHAVDTGIILNTGEHYSMTLPALRRNKLYQKNINFYEKNGMKKSVQNYKLDPYSFPYEIHHDAMPGESYGDLLATRYWLDKVGIFDSKKKGLMFSNKEYEEVKNRKDLPFNVKRFFQNFSKDDYIYIINNIASNKKKLNPRRVEI